MSSVRVLASLALFMVAALVAAYYTQSAPESMLFDRALLTKSGESPHHTGCDHHNAHSHGRSLSLGGEHHNHQEGCEFSPTSAPAVMAETCLTCGLENCYSEPTCGGCTGNQCGVDTFPDGTPTGFFCCEACCGGAVCFEDADSCVPECTSDNLRGGEEPICGSDEFSFGYCCYIPS